MKVGIITVYYANYGSYYQAEALRKAVENLGHECELVNTSIRGLRLYKYYLGKFIDRLMPDSVMNVVADRINEFNIYRSLKNDVKRLKVSPVSFSMKKLSKRYDCVIVGSDILWAVTNPCMKYIPAYFGEGITCPHFSYATSALTLQNPQPLIEKRMIEGLKGFISLSGRDNFTCNYVREKTGKECELTIDPTLLNPYFGSMGTGGGGYILVYGEHFTKEQIEKIRTFSRQMKWRTKAVSWHQTWCDEFQNVNSGEELQKLYSASEYCMASTFHGTIFAVLNHRQFTAFPAPGRTEKIQFVLNQIGLGNRVFTGKNVDCINMDINYDQVDRKLSEWQEKSYMFLRKALQQCEEFINEKGKRNGNL